MNKRSDLDIFLDSVTTGITRMDMNTFGNVGGWFNFDTLIAQSWTKRILSMIRDLDATDLTDKEKARLFTTASQLRCSAGFDLWAAKYAKISRKEREQIFLFYRKLIRALCINDPFALSKNLIHSERELKKFLSSIQPATSEDAKLLGKIASACYHLSHAMYSDMNPSIVYDNYGPYYIRYKGRKYLLAIKEFTSLQALELWPETRSIPAKHIRLICLYKLKVKMSVDAISHALYQGNLIENLAYYRLQVDGKAFSIEKTSKLLSSLENKASAIFQKVRAQNAERKKEIYYFQKAYAYKNIYDYLSQPWRPSQETLREAKGRALYQIRWPQAHKQQKKVLRKTFDPRLDFKV